MRHNNAGRRLGRTTSHRTAMFRNMVTSLLNHERITTTDAKAKELRSVAEKIITLGKRGDLHSLRQASAYVRDKQVVTKLFTTIAPRYKDRAGGYTRIIKLGVRPGDNAPVSIIELVEEQLPAAKAKTAAPKKRPAASKPVETAPVVAEQTESKVEPATAQAEEVAAEASLTAVAEEGCEAKAD
jgi:large subunit ribosomal protein L17